MSAQIHYNGKTYNSLEEMPPEVRQAYAEAMALFADKNGNGLPDFMDSLVQGQSLEQVLQPLQNLSSTYTQFAYNGQTYPNLDAMPPEARQAYEQALAAANQHHSGLPGALEQGGFVGAPPVVNVSHTSLPRRAPPQPMNSPYTPAGLEPDGPAASARRIRTIAFAVLGLAVLVLIAAVSLLVVALPALLGR